MTSTSSRARSKSEVVRSLYSYEGNDGMIFGPGEKIAVTEKSHNGWWRGTLSKNGRNVEGWFPAGYVEIDVDQSTQIEVPSSTSNGSLDVPNGWKQALSEDGRTYYYNELTQETSWHCPHNQNEELLACYNNNVDKPSPPKTAPKPVSHVSPLASNETTPVLPKKEASNRRGSKSSVGKYSLGDGSNSSPSPHSSQGSLDSFGTVSRRRKTKAINLTPIRPSYFNFPLPGEGSDQGLLNSLQDSYCDYFWEDREDATGFEVVLDHVYKGRGTCKEMADFFRERALIEDLYARNLARLSKSAYADLEQGTLGRAWQRLKKGLEEEALYHQRLSQKLVETLEKSFTDYSEIPPPQKKEIKKLETTVQEGRKKVITKFKELEKQKNAYAEKQKSLETLQSGQSPNKVTEKDICKAKKKAMSAVDDMKRTCDEYNDAQRKWIEESTLALIELEKVEKERVEFVKDNLMKYVELFDSTLESNSKVLADVNEKVGFVDAAQDKEEFVHKYGTGKIRPVDLSV